MLFAACRICCKVHLLLASGAAAVVVVVVCWECPKLHGVVVGLPVCSCFGVSYLEKV